MRLNTAWTAFLIMTSSNGNIFRITGLSKGCLQDGGHFVQASRWQVCDILHDDIIKWKHFPRYWPFLWDIHRWLVKSPHKGQWRGALMFSLNCAWINGWVHNGEAGDLRRHRAHYHVMVDIFSIIRDAIKSDEYCISQPRHTSGWTSDRAICYDGLSVREKGLSSGLIVLLIETDALKLSLTIGLDGCDELLRNKQ